MKTIEIVVSPTGQTRLETKGYSGTTCQAASRFLEQALGQKLSERSTGEAHRSAGQVTEETERA